MPSTQRSTIPLDDDDRGFVETIQTETGITSLVQTIRYALRTTASTLLQKSAVAPPAPPFNPPSAPSKGNS